MPKKNQKNELEERIKFLERENNQLRKELVQSDLNCSESNKKTQRSQDLLQLVLDSIPDRVFWKDRDSVYLGCNHHFAKDAGLESPDQIIGKNDFELNWHEQAELYRSDDRQVMESGMPKLNFEETQTWPDGTELCLRTSKVPLKDQEGTIFGVMGCYEDVTERKSIELRALHFGQILEGSLNEIYIFDPDSLKFIEVNRGARNNLGYSLEELRELTPLDIKPAHTTETFDKLISPLRTGKKGMVEFETFHKRKDGSTYPVEVHLQLSTFGDQQTFVAMILDITERKNMENSIQTLIESSVGRSGDDFFHRTMEKLCDWMNADCAIVSELQVEGRVNALSMLWDGEKITQYSYCLPDTPCEMVVKNGFSFYPENVCDLFPDDKELVEMGAESYVGILLRDKEDHPLGILCIISRQKMKPSIQMKNVLEIIAAKAAVEIERRKTELQLISSKEKAEAADRLKSEFLAVMSHEIRTPMNTILGMLDLLDETSLTKEQLDYLRTSMRAGDTLLHLIDDIIDLSKIEADQIRIEEVNFYLDEIFSERLAAFTNKARGKNIQLVSNISEGIPKSLLGDPTRLFQVIDNLLGNAIKFTEEGKVTIEVEVSEKRAETDSAKSPAGRLQSAEKCTLLFSIGDTGIGIPKEKQNMIFDLFSQADTSTTRKFGGVGIGLSISKKLVEKMGGRIWVESEVGKGSTFYFTVPLGMSKKDEPPNPFRETARKVETSLNERPFKILLVEDSEDNRLLIQHYLKKTPYQVDVAENGKFAVQMFESDDYGLVLMDLEMPIMDGYAATREIRKFEAEKRKETTPIIAITAHAQKEHHQKSIDAGCTDHISKPIKKKKLLEVICEYTNNTA